MNQAAVDLYKAGSKRNLLGSLDRVIIMGDFQHFIDQEVAFTNGEDSWVGDGERQSTDEGVHTRFLTKVSVLSETPHRFSPYLLACGVL